MEANMTEETQYQEVDRRSSMSLKEFRRDYLYAGRPVVITNATDGWRARSTWTFEYFKSRYGETPVDIHCLRAGNYDPSNVERMPVGEFIDKILANDSETCPYYVRDDWKLFRKHKELLEDYRIPEYFFDWFALMPEFMRLIYPRIFIGPKGAVTPLHDDVWGTHAWLAELVGRKRWILFSPDQRELLYDYKVQPDKPDLERFPLFRRAKPLESTIGPGDIIFVPGGWPHYVISLDPTISLTHNFMGPGCFRSSLSSSIRERVFNRF
jgi:Cupin-like domain